MAISWPRTILPQKVTPLGSAGPFRSRGGTGKDHVAASRTRGRQWTETYPPIDMSTAAARTLLATIERVWRTGATVALVHPGHATRLGGGTGAPLVNGAGQSGASLVTDGWTGANPVLRAGDLLTVAGVPYTLRVTADVSHSAGAATLAIDPPIAAADAPSDNAALTVTGVTLLAYLASAPSIPAVDEDGFLRGLAVTFLEAYEGAAGGGGIIETPTLSLVTAPAGAVDNVAFSTQPRVAVSQVASGVVITAAILTGTGSLIGTASAVTDDSGVATWANLGIDASSTPAAFTLRFTASGYEAVTSPSFTVITPSVGSSRFPNEPIGGGWDRVVDYTWTQPPAEWVSGGVPDNGSGLFNYLREATRVRWAGGPNGTFLSTVTDQNCPAADTVLRVRMPEGFYGLNFIGEGAVVEQPDQWRYVVTSPPGGKQSFTFSFGETLPNNSCTISVFPPPAGVGYPSAYNITTTGVTITFPTVVPQGVTFGIAGGWEDQGTISAFSATYPGVFAWPENRRGTGHIYIAYWHKVSPGYTHYGSNGIHSVGSKNIFLQGTRGTLGLLAPQAANPVILGSTRSTNEPVELSCSSWTNQYSDSGNNDYRFFTFNAGNFSEGANSRNPLFQAEDGNWHLHEYICQPNTFVGGVPQSDGVLTYFMDGIQRSTSGGINFWGVNATPCWSDLGLANTYGGGYARCPAEQFMYYGPIRVAVR
jgi:hypothetical protein